MYRKIIKRDIMQKIKLTIYDFGFHHEGSSPDNLAALTEAYKNGVEKAALYLGFHYFPPKGEDPEQALYWFNIASTKHDISAIAANRWLAKCFADGIGTEINYWHAYLHNEVYFNLYNRYWPAPEEERLHPDNYKFLIYKNLAEAASARLSDAEKKSAIEAAQAFCEEFPKKLEQDRIKVPDFLMKRL